MKILGFKEGHDGSVALIEDGHLVFHLEPEKDSFPRCSEITAELLSKAAALTASPPDILAIGGWTKGKYSSERPSLSGYFGVDPSRIIVRGGNFFGSPVTIFSSSHERSHIWSAYGLSPFRQGQPCHVLVWEGNVGNFYTIDESLKIADHGTTLTDPGNKYTFLYSLADTKSPSTRGFWDTSHPGKLMALAAYGDRGTMSDDEKAVTDCILSKTPIMTTTLKDDLSWSPYHNVGVESRVFKDLAAKFTDKIFEIFFEAARKTLRPGLPLLIAGGCGLNCEWNSRWRDCGLFADVFVPPCCNDSGSALGTAIDAMQHLTGNAKIRWDAYAGEEFDWDREPSRSSFREIEYDHDTFVSSLIRGAVVAWVEGRYEIGPRALGHRSLLAEPFSERTRNRLNRIKHREQFRPIAPVCLQSEVGEHFDPAVPSPHMLYFYHVKNKCLRAVTHVDGSARIQSVEDDLMCLLPGLLARFGSVTGASVLCNTSLNFHGRGFINSTSDLVEYCERSGIEFFVVNGRAFENLTSSRERE